MIHVRLEKLTQHMVTNNLDCVAIMPGPNMHYFAELDFHLSERPILAFFQQAGDPALVVPGFEQFKTTASPDPLPWRIFPWDDEEGPAGAFAACCEALGLNEKRLGVESLALRFAEYQLVTNNAPNVMITDADPLITEMRQIKDEVEIAHMRAAVEVVETALTEIIPKIKVGMTEKEVAAELLVSLFKGGSEALPFDPLVQTGETGATPHASPGDRQIREGDLLIIDIGARINGYVSDITRTFAVKSLNEKAQQVYEAVKQANAAGRTASKPGIACQDVDRAARQIIDEADFGEYFIHRTGHGIGLEGHEPPYMVEGDKNPLEPGMTYTVEPGIYIQGVGGVRIEDDVVITENGAESLTSFNRELTLVG
ncbi:MAG: Xaa-Pro peptidase family protein [Chloroflexota bacterium]